MADAAALEFPLRERLQRADTSKMSARPPTADRRKSPRQARARRIAGKAIVAVFLAAGLAIHADVARAAWRELRLVSPSAMVLLVAAALGHRSVHALLVGRATPGLRWHRAVLISEAHAGCANTVVGGAAIGTGLKAAMLRSYGFSGPDIAASILAVGTVPSIAMWTVALVNTGPRVLSGTASPFHTTVAAVALAVVIGQIVFWWVAMIHPAPARRAGALFNRLLPRLRRCCRGPLRPLHRHLDGVEGGTASEAVRARGLELLRARGATLLASALLAQLTLASLLLLSVRAVGGTVAEPLDVFEAFAIARVAASFIPLPGGIGVLDAGLFTGLVGAGVSAPAAVAALVVYRAITFILPIVTGLLSVTWWRRVERRRPQQPDVPLGSAGPAVACAVPQFVVGGIGGQLETTAKTIR